MIRFPFPRSNRVRKDCCSYPTIKRLSKEALWINVSTFPHPPLPHPQPCQKSSKCRCQVGGVGDRHTTFLGLDTESETAPKLSASERITAVEIFKSCGSACSHTSLPTAPASTFQSPRAKHTGFIGSRDSECQDSGAPRNPVPIQTKPTHPDCVPPSARAKSGSGGTSRWALGGPAPAPSTPESGIPLLSPSAVPGRRGFVSRSRHSALSLDPRKRGIKGQNSPTPRTQAPGKASFWGSRPAPPSAEEACVGPPVAERRRRQGVRGRRPWLCPNFGEPSGLTRARPPRRVEDGRGGGMIAPGGRSGRGGGARAPGQGQHTSAPYSPRAGAARHSQSASSAHSGAGRRAGIFSVASSAASACADPHEEGVPTEDPPLSSFLLLFCGSRPRAVPRSSGVSVPTARTPGLPIPGRRLSRRPKFGWNFLGCAAKQPRVSFRLSRLLPPQTPPPCRHGRAPPPSAPRGFPQEEAPARAARGGIYYESSDCPSKPSPARVWSRRALTQSALDCLAGLGLCRRRWVIGPWTSDARVAETVNLPGARDPFPWDKCRPHAPTLTHTPGPAREGPALSKKEMGAQAPSPLTRNRAINPSCVLHHSFIHSASISLNPLLCVSMSSAQWDRTAVGGCTSHLRRILFCWRYSL